MGAVIEHGQKLVDAVLVLSGCAAPDKTETAAGFPWGIPQTASELASGTVTDGLLFLG